MPWTAPTISVETFNEIFRETLREAARLRLHAIVPENDANRIIRMCDSLMDLIYYEQAYMRLEIGDTADEVCYFLFGEGATLDEEFRTNPVEDESFFK